MTGGWWDALWFFAGVVATLIAAEIAGRVFIHRDETQFVPMRRDVP